MSGWTVAWLAWIVAFFAIEIPGLLLTYHGEGTLSAHIRSWFATSRGAKGPLVRVRRIVLLAGLAWLVVHLLTGGWV